MSPEEVFYVSGSIGMHCTDLVDSSWSFFGMFVKNHTQDLFTLQLN